MPSPPQTAFNHGLAPQETNTLRGQASQLLGAKQLRGTRWGVSGPKGSEIFDESAQGL
ncbi:MAG: hypothetical protein Pyrs2KO_30100 [Pyruvatibacter sp.]